MHMAPNKRKNKMIAIFETSVIIHHFGIVFKFFNGEFHLFIGNSHCTDSDTGLSRAISGTWTSSDFLCKNLSLILNLWNASVV